MDSSAAFAIGVLCDIYAFHRYTTHSAYFSLTQEDQFQWRYGVELRSLTTDLTFRLRTL